MPEWGEGVRHFMKYWFSGLMNALESVDEPARKAILRECGKACAESYTAEVFQDARERSTDMEAFLAVLAARFPEATYEQLTSGTIRVRYTSCACDLVKCGLVKSSLICECSAYNLQENFERAWGIPVSVTLEASILRGAPQCVFLVSLERLFEREALLSPHLQDACGDCMSSVVNSSIILETERLILRRQQAADIAPLVNLWADPEVTRYMGGPRDRDWLQSVFEETAQDPYAERYDLWPVIEKETGQVVGHCGLLDKEVEGRTEIELSYILVSSAWGKGYATEMGLALKRHAFESMRIDRLIALIEPENVASERVAVKIGLRFEKEVVRPGGALRKAYAIEAKDEGAAT